MHKQIIALKPWCRERAAQGGGKLAAASRTRHSAQALLTSGEHGRCQHPKKKAKSGSWEEGRERTVAKTHNPNNQKEKIENKKSVRRKEQSDDQ